MRTRIITGAVGIPIILLCLFTVRPLMIALVVFLMAFSQYELSHMYASSNGRGFLLLPIIGCALLLGCYLMNFLHWASIAQLMYFFVLALAAIALYPTIFVKDIAFGYFMFLYGGWTFMHALVLYDEPKGSWLLLAVFVTVWCCDSGAYFIGRAFGKHKMAPFLSPKKTVEGALGGIAVSIPAVVLLNIPLDILPSIGAAALFAFLVATLGILGDLFESYLKRMFEVKDSGKLLPGHGGVLDRFDSFLFVIPLCSYILPLLYKI